MGYAILGITDTLELRRLTFYDPMVSTQHEPCEDLKASQNFTFGSLEEAAELADRLIRMDRVFWPPFNPVIAETIPDGSVTKLFSPGGEMDQDIGDAAEIYGLTAATLEPV